MKSTVCFVALLLLQQQSGCDQSPKPVEKEKRLPPIHRFENVSEHSESPGVALDTVTEQLCKTWDWSYKNTAMSGGLDTLPTCLRIFQDTPTSEEPAK